MAKGNITWFEFPLYFDTLLETYSAEAVIKAELAACEYGRTGKIPELGINEMIVFKFFKKQVDKAKEDYKKEADKWGHK